MAVTDISSTRATWQGFLIEDPRVVATITSGDEDGLHVGPATPTATGSLILRTVRSERATSQSNLVLTCTRPGASSSQGMPAEVTATVGSGQAMGWQDPVAPIGFARLGSSAFGDIRICRRGGGYGSLVKSSDLDAWTSGEAHDICPGDTSGSVLYVGLYDDGSRLVLRSALYLDGATTSPQSSEQRTTISTTTITRVRVAAYGGTAMVLAQLGTAYDRLHQWASDDGGLSWRYVGTTATTSTDYPYGLGDICAGPDGYVAALAVGDQSGTVTNLDTKLLIARVASPFLAAWAGQTTVVTASFRIWDDTPNDQVSFLQVTICREETGRLWLYTIELPTDGGGTEDRHGFAWWSTDGGATWSPTYDLDPNYWLSWDNAGDRPTALDSDCIGGAVLLAFSATSSAYVLRMGGWAGRGLTVTGATTGPHRRGPESLTHGWDQTIMGIGVLPSALGWTSSGTATATAANDHTSWTGAGAPRILRRYDLAVTPSTAVIALTVRASAAQTSEQAPVIFDLVSASGGARYGLRVAIGSDAVALYRRTLVGWTIVGSAATHSYGDVWTSWLLWLAIDSGGAATIRVAGRSHGSATLAIAATDVLDGWSDHISTTASCTDVVAVEPAARIAIGGYVASGEVGRVAFLGYTSTSGTRVAGYPSQIPGRSLGPLFWAPPDVLVQAGSGVARTGDLWTISDEADGAVANLLDPDLTLPWRAPGTSAATITLTWGDAQPIGGIMGLLLRGIVAEAVTVRGDGTEDLGLVRATIPLDAVKAGKVIKPDPAASVAFHLREAEGGGYVRVNDGSAPAVAAIAQARGGAWGGVSGPARLVLATEPAATDGAVDIEIMSRDLLLLWHNNDDYSSVTIELGAATSTWPSGTKWQISRAMVGPVILLGDRWDAGISLTTVPNIDEGKTSDGRIRPRSIRPPHRVLGVNWQYGVPEDRMAETVPQVVGDGSNNPSAWVGATAHTIEGLIRELEGSAAEVVAILGVGYQGIGEESSKTLYRREQFIHGRIVSSVQRDVTMGEGVPGNTADDVVKVGTLTIEELT